VIALIGILAALLLPVLSASKQRAWTIQCSSNLRQIGLGMTMFADDANGLFPESGAVILWDQIDPTTQKQSWMQQIVPCTKSTKSRDQMLRSCERKYFFQYLADAYLNSPEPWLRAIALLKKVKNIPMWQGECVHDAIAEFLTRYNDVCFKWPAAYGLSLNNWNSERVGVSPAWRIFNRNRRALTGSNSICSPSPMVLPSAIFFHLPSTCASKSNA